jgi:glycosyltransferase involved in cell wall biosynthesis
MYKGQGVTVVIPTKNEIQNLERLLPTIPNYVDEVLVVDGYSTDGTAEFAQESKFVTRVLMQKAPGKGSALCLGLQKASHKNIICIDADGSMSTSEFPKLLHPLIEEDVDVIKGSRYLAGAGSEDLSFFRSTGNLGLLLLTKALYKCDWSELAYGYFGLNQDAVRKLDLYEFESKIPSTLIFKKMAYGQGFEIEAVIFCRALRRNLKIKEFPSIETNRWNGTSNLKAIPDGFRVLSAVVLERIRTQRLFN